jgi:hypothetical protein
MGNGMRIALSALAAGYFGCASIVYPAHANAPRGTFVSFDAPAGGLDLLPNGINPAGTITGIYSLLFGKELLDFGFQRTPDGRVTTIAVPGATSTIVGSELLYLGFVSAGPPINPVGAITESYLDASGFHGFLRDPDDLHHVRCPRCRQRYGTRRHQPSAGDVRRLLRRKFRGARLPAGS